MLVLNRDEGYTKETEDIYETADNE